VPETGFSRSIGGGDVMTPWESLRAATAQGGPRKMCRTCRRALPLDAFMSNVRYADGHHPDCRGCRSAKRAVERRAYPTYAEAEARRAAAKVGGPSEAVTAQFRVAAIGSPCPRCEQPLEADSEVDHVLALVDGGAHTVENWQALHHTCHVEKTREETKARRQKG
jgi:5-methylcytosine-specific restriction endonuclease McrA